MAPHDSKCPKQHKTPLLNPKRPVFPNTDPCGPTNWIWAKKTKFESVRSKVCSFHTESASFLRINIALESDVHRVQLQSIVDEEEAEEEEKGMKWKHDFGISCTWTFFCTSHGKGESNFEI